MALIAAAVAAVFNPAWPGLCTDIRFTRGHRARISASHLATGHDYEWLNDGCDVTNKAPMTTGPNGRWTPAANCGLSMPIVRYGWSKGAVGAFASTYKTIFIAHATWNALQKSFAALRAAEGIGDKTVAADA